MGGYGARKEVNTGIHDPLLAKVLLIRTEQEQAAIVTYDLVGFRSERVARSLKEQHGFDHVLQIVSHTHSGPIPKDRNNPTADPWGREVEDKVIQLVGQAKNSFVPAQLAVTETSVILGHNRRQINPDGTVTMFWRNEERTPTAPIDPAVGILRFTDPAGEVLAVLVNYACHPVVLGPDNLQYSADYPGYMYRYIEEKLGDPTVCFFMPGAAGDINPFNDKQPVDQNGFGIARQAGEELAVAVLQALEKLPKTGTDPDLRIEQELFRFRNRFEPDKQIPVQTTYLYLGLDTAILMIPGEVFIDHQLNLKDRSPLPHTFLFGYTFSGEGEIAGYVPTIQAAAEGGYGASYRTRVEVGAGERMVDRAVIWIHQQLDQLRGLPGAGN
jgi:hypothetical protein